MECEFCKKLFSNKQTLKTHQTTSKKCRKTQENPVKPIFTCKFCLKECSSKVRLEEHETKCIEKFKIDLAEKDKRIKELEEKLAEKEKRLQQLDIKPKREREFDTLEDCVVNIEQLKDDKISNIFDWTTQMESAKKKDDLADSFLQGVYFYNNGKPHKH